jgi:hypothetical protein
MKKKNNKKDELLELAREFCLTCPCCGRKMPNFKFKRNKGCKWCKK